METKEFRIGVTPALLVGEPSERVFLFVHGLHGRKEESLSFAEVAVPKGYQVLGIDLPLERRPWEVMPLLREVREYLGRNWNSVSIRANSIGAWYSLLAFGDMRLDMALFVSPLLDMKKYIEDMPSYEEDFHEWAVNNPIMHWDTPTYILQPETDLIVKEAVGREFIQQHKCRLTIMPDGEHWFHTPEQLAFLKSWEMSVLATPPEVTLAPLQSEDREQFIRDNQWAFKYGAQQEFGMRDDRTQEGEEVISRKTIERSIDGENAEAYRIVQDGRKVGGLVLQIDREAAKGELELLFVLPEVHSKGIGQAAWKAVEAMHPEIKVWEAITPYFEKRNIHFYVNRCGFHIVEFWNKHHHGPAVPENMEEDWSEDDEMFVFRKEIR